MTGKWTFHPLQNQESSDKICLCHHKINHHGPHGAVIYTSYTWCNSKAFTQVTLPASSHEKNQEIQRDNLKIFETFLSSMHFPWSCAISTLILSLLFISTLFLSLQWVDVQVRISFYTAFSTCLICPWILGYSFLQKLLCTFEYQSTGPIPPSFPNFATTYRSSRSEVGVINSLKVWNGAVVREYFCCYI